MRNGIGKGAAMEGLASSGVGCLLWQKIYVAGHEFRENPDQEITDKMDKI